MADQLPTELWRRIFSSIPDVLTEEEAQSVPAWASYWYAPLPLVCKQWYRPARSALYERIVVTSWVQFNLLYETLLYINPDNGVLIKELDLNEMMPGQNALLPRLLNRFLPAMPQLQSFRAPLHSYDNDLSTLPFFKALRRYQISLSSGQDILALKHHIPAGTSIPPNLVSLEIKTAASGNISPEQPDPKRISLQRLERLSINGRPNPATQENSVEVWDLPGMPVLTSLSLAHCDVHGAGGESPAARLLREVAPTLKHLELYFSTSSGRGLAGGHLLQLQKLETLAVLSMCQQAGPIEHELPHGLRELTFEWEGRVSLGTSLLRHLSYPDYLPKLRKCPRILHYGSFRSHTLFRLPVAQQDELDHKEMFRQRDLALESLVKRPIRMDCYLNGTVDANSENFTLLLPRYNNPQFHKARYKLIVAPV